MSLFELEKHLHLDEPSKSEKGSTCNDETNSSNENASIRNESSKDAKDDKEEEKYNKGDNTNKSKN